jgi:hypothetical protein
MSTLLLPDKFETTRIAWKFSVGTATVDITAGKFMPLA